MINRRVVLRSRPSDVPKPQNFELIEDEAPSPGPNQMLVRNLYFSMEPAIRGWLDDRESYMPPIAIGEAIRSPTMGRVVRSNNPRFKEGDLVRGLNAWEDYSLLTDETILLERLEPEEGVPLSYYVGALGGSGLTAYVGLHDIARIKSGETVLISAAAGAVGNVAGQIARIHGCKVVGLVGSSDKASLIIRRLGFARSVNYRDTDDLAASIREACPAGVDVYFDNVGGQTLDAALTCMNVFGRIVNCGMIAGYNRQDRPPPIYNLWEMVARQLRMQGFLLPAHAQSIPGALKALHGWIRSGDLIVVENLSRGIEKAAETFCNLMAGKTIGKTVVEVDQPEASAPMSSNPR